AALADTAGKQSATVASVRRAYGEQTNASEQIASAVGEMRGRLRETVAASAAQAKGVAIFGREIKDLSTQIGRIREANLDLAEQLAAVSSSLPAESRAASELA
ncbi:MAG TPA: hypothetical protein VK509_07590, partial [Polyangiales bacterium]|nr:hypothetical protein [Polyangiales bacterium]